jgi:hypothetical protein
MSALNQSITVFAGTTTAGYSGDNGPAINAQLNEPSSLALDGAGNLFIADTGNNVIRKIDLATGIITTAVGTGTAGYSDSGPVASALLTTPISLTVDPGGNLYFLEKAPDDAVTDYKVREVNAVTQTLSVVAGSGVEGYTGDGGPAVDAEIDPIALSSDWSGNLYIVQQSGSTIEYGGIIRVVSGGVISRFAGSETGPAGDGAPALDTGFYHIGNVFFDAGGNTYFVDGATCCVAIRKLDASAAHLVSTVFHSDAVAVNYLIESLVLDPAGNFYSSDDFSLAEKISTQAAPLSFASTNAGKLSSPLQLVYYNTGNEAFSLATMSFTGTNPGDFAQTNNCPSSLAPGAGCNDYSHFSAASDGHSCSESGGDLQRSRFSA